MEKDTRISEKVKNQIERFSHQLSQGLDKPRKRFFRLPIFKQYAIADGIYRLLFNTKWGLREKIPKIDMSQQMFGFAMET
jgi:hypothetical protein